MRLAHRKDDFLRSDFACNIRYLGFIWFYVISFSFLIYEYFIAGTQKDIKRRQTWGRIMLRRSQAYGGMQYPRAIQFCPWLSSSTWRLHSGCINICSPIIREGQMVAIAWGFIWSWNLLQWLCKSEKTLTRSNGLLGFYTLMVFYMNTHKHIFIQLE